MSTHPEFATNCRKAADPPADNNNPFSPEERSFHALVPAVTTQEAPGGHHAMAGDSADAATLHDVSDGARRARLARRLRDIPVRSDLSGRDAPDRGENALVKRGRHSCENPSRTREPGNPRT